MTNATPHDGGVAVIMRAAADGPDWTASLSSIRRQTWPPSQAIVVVEDGVALASPPPPARAIEAFPAVQIVAAPAGSGFSALRNAGGCHARCPYLCWIEPGDELDCTYFEKAAILLHRHAEAAFVYPLLQDGPAHRRIEPGLQPYDFFALLTRNLLPGCAVVRRSLFEELRGFDEELAARAEAEWDFWLRAGLAGRFGHALAEPLVIRRHAAKGDDAEPGRDLMARRHPDLFRRAGQLGRRWEERTTGRAGMEALYRKRAARWPRALRPAVVHWNLAGLHHGENWRREPLRCALVMTPVALRRRLNRLAGRTVISESICVDAPAPPAAVVEPAYPPPPSGPAGDGRPAVLLVLACLPMGGIESLLIHLVERLSDEFRFVIVTTHPHRNSLHARFAARAPVYDLPHLLGTDALRRRYMIDVIRRQGIARVMAINARPGLEILPELAAQGLRVRAVVSLHGWGRNLDNMSTARSFSPFLDRIVCVSEPVRAEYERRYGPEPRLTVIPNVLDYERLLDDERSATAPPAGMRRADAAQRNVVFLGRYNPDKQPHLFLDLAERLACDGSHDHLRFFLFGEGVDREALVRRADDANRRAGRTAVVVGERQDNVAAVLAQSDVLVNGSPNEGFGLAPLEAVFFGVPVVAFDLDVFRRHLPPDHYYPVKDPPPGEAQSFVQPLMTALQRLPSPEEKRRMRDWVLRNGGAEAFYSAYRTVLRGDGGKVV